MTSSLVFAFCEVCKDNSDIYNKSKGLKVFFSHYAGDYTNE